MKSQKSKLAPATHCVYCETPLLKDCRETPLFPRAMRQRFTIDSRFVRSMANDLRHARLSVPVCKACKAAGDLAFDDAFLTELVDGSLSAARKMTPAVLVLASRLLKGLAYLDQGAAPGRTSTPSRLVHILAQSLTTGARFQDGKKSWTPGTLLVFDLHSPQRGVDQFDFHYDPAGAISMRLGRRGLIAIIDGGFLGEDHGAFFLRQARRRLHPIQFQELGSVAFYRSSLMKGRCKFKSTANRNQPPVFSKDKEALRSWKSWKQPLFAPIMSAFTKYPADVLNPGGGDAIMTWVFDGQGKPLKLDFKRLPFFREP